MAEYQRGSTGQEFAEGVKDRQGGLTVMAATALEQVAADGDELPGREPMLTVVAIGTSRRPRRLTSSQTESGEPSERGQDRAKKEKVEFKHG